MKFKLVESMKYYPHDYDKIELEYKRLEMGDEYISWTFEVDKEDVYNYIYEDCLTEEDFPAAFEDEFDPNNAENWKEFTDWLEDNFEDVFTKYQSKILNHYREQAAEEAEENYDPDNYIDWDSMPGGHDDYKFDESINEGEDMKFKLVEATESKICCICKKPFDGYGNNAEPVCSGSCCDECNMKEVIPARMKMLDDSSSKDLTEDLEDYKITYYLSTATAERRPETIEDVENDWKEDIFAANSDYDALLYSLELIDSGYDETDFSTAEEIVQYFEEKDLGDGSPFVVKLEGPNGVIYDMGQTKDDFIEQVKENDEMLSYYRSVLGIDESLNESKELNESLSEKQIADILNDAKHNSDASQSEYYWIGYSAAAFLVKESDLFLLLPDHISEEDVEYKEMIRGYKDNNGYAYKNEGMNDSAETIMTEVVHKIISNEAAIKDIFDAYEETRDDSDSYGGDFNEYSDDYDMISEYRSELISKLIEIGVPKSFITFIHEEGWDVGGITGSYFNWSYEQMIKDLSDIDIYEDYIDNIDYYNESLNEDAKENLWDILNRLANE